MTRIIEAIYENGVFRPTENVPFAEGQRVALSVSDDSADSAKSPGQRAYEMIAEIAAIPSKSPDDGFSGADHDKILYGGKDGVR